MLKTKGMKNTVAKRLIGLLLGTAFVIATFFGAHLMMRIDSNGVMQNCPLLGQTQTVCTMNVTEHTAKWQQMFTFTLQSNKLLFAVLVFIAFAFTAFLLQFSLSNPLHFQAVGIKAGPPEYSQSFVLRALARGILRKRE